MYLGIVKVRGNVLRSVSTILQDPLHDKSIWLARISAHPRHGSFGLLSKMSACTQARRLFQVGDKVGLWRQPQQQYSTCSTATSSAASHYSCMHDEKGIVPSVGGMDIFESTRSLVATALPVRL